VSVKRFAYNVLYRIGAPWEGPVRPSLVDLVKKNRISPAEQHSVVDLGCGSGTCAVYLAERGFDVVGVDFTPIALRRARRAADEAGVADHCRFVQGDLTATSVPGVEGEYVVLLDFGTLDDLTGEDRDAMVRTIRRLSRPGSVFVLWCFYTDGEGLPLFRYGGASRFLSALRPGEEQELFGDDFEIERLADPPPESHTACFVMTRR
jgi:SAM-dependent methyltransferase